MLDTVDGSEDPTEDLTYDEYDGLLITEWFEAESANPPAPASGREWEYKYAHENPDAWQYVTLPSGVSKLQAHAMLVAVVEGTVRHMPGQHAQKTHGGGRGAGPTVMSTKDFEEKYPEGKRWYRGVGSVAGGEATKNGEVGGGDYGKGVYLGSLGTAQSYANKPGKSDEDSGRVMRIGIKDSAKIMEPPDELVGSAEYEKWATENNVDVVELTASRLVKNPAVMEIDEKLYTVNESVVLDYVKEGYSLDSLPAEYDDAIKSVGAKRHLPGKHNQKTHGGKGGSTGGAPVLSDALAADLHGKLSEPDGGFTIDPHTGKAVTSGYAVAAFKDRSKVVQSKDVKPGDLQRYVADNGDILAEPGNMFGGWHDPATGEVWLDVSTVLSDKDAALKLGKEKNQIAIFDLSNFESIDTGGTGRGIQSAFVAGSTAEWFQPHEGVQRRSQVDRSVQKVGDNCPQCQANNDPDKVPVHPNCNCNVVTDNVEMGIDDLGERAEVVVGVPNTGTATELSLRELRYSDILQWYDQIVTLQGTVEQFAADEAVESAEWLTFIVDNRDTVTMLVQRITKALRYTEVQSGQMRVLTLPVSETNPEALARIYRALTEGEVTDDGEAQE